MVRGGRLCRGRGGRTSGIAGEYVGGWVGELYEEGHLFDGRFNIADLAGRISKLPLTRQPGTFWRYGYSSEVLGRVIEVASGKTLFNFMKQNIFDPLGMGDSTAETGDYARRADRAIGHAGGYATVPLKTPLIPSGGVYTSARDMIGYLAFHLGRGTFGHRGAPRGPGP